MLAMTQGALSRPGWHYVKLTAPGYRTPWIAGGVDLKTVEETTDIDPRLPQG